MPFEIKNGELCISWSYKLEAAIQLFWPFISDTNRTNRYSGEPVTKFEETPDANGGSIRIATQRHNGFLLQYREYPFEWVKENYFEVERVYLKGPLKRLHLSIVIDAVTEKNFVFKQTFRVVPRTWVVAPIIVGEMLLAVRPRFLKLYKNICARLSTPSKGIEQPLPSEIDQTLLDDLKKKFQSISSDEELNKKIAVYLLQEAEVDLVRIRSHRVAHKIGEPRKKVLEFFLRGTKNSLFEMNWDILCPSCRGAKQTTHKLYDLKKEAHCSSCNISYSAEFDKSVEVSFTPHPSIRNITQGEYCIGGPGSTPHVLSQLRVPAKSSRTLEITCHKGSYKLWSNASTKMFHVEVHEKFSSPSLIPPCKFSKSESDAQELSLSPGKVQLLLENSMDHEITVKFEDASWLQDIVTANELTTMQEFRDLFSAEVLRPGQEIAIKSLAIFFTDLKSSTQFYNLHGDASAFTTVRNHFDILTKAVNNYDGAVVKTIGDSVMACFSSPLNAVLAALSAQKDLEVFNKTIRFEGLQLKIGIHFGPVLAVNLNDRLDYFGQTVNLAARVESLCEGGDIILSKSLYEHEGIAQMLKEKKVKSEEFTSKLKGFDSLSNLVRLRLPR